MSIVTEPPKELCPICGATKYVGMSCPSLNPGGPGHPGQPSSFTEPIQPDAPITDPCIAVPPDFPGSDAEAVGIAVAAAVQHVVLQRDSWESYCRSTRDALAKLIERFPATSFAGANVALEEAQQWLAFVSQHLDPQEPEQRT